MKHIFDLLRNKRLYQNKAFNNEFTTALSNTLKKEKISERDMNRYYREAEEALNVIQNHEIDIVKDEKNIFRKGLLNQLEQLKDKYDKVLVDEISTRIRQDKNARYKLNRESHSHLKFEDKQYNDKSDYIRKILEENRKKKK